MDIDKEKKILVKILAAITRDMLKEGAMMPIAKEILDDKVVAECIAKAIAKAKAQMEGVAKDIFNNIVVPKAKVIANEITNKDTVNEITLAVKLATANKPDMDKDKLANEIPIAMDKGHKKLTEHAAKYIAVVIGKKLADLGKESPSP